MSYTYIGHSSPKDEIYDPEFPNGEYLMPDHDSLCKIKLEVARKELATLKGWAREAMKYIKDEQIYHQVLHHADTPREEELLAQAKDLMSLCGEEVTTPASPSLNLVLPH